MKKFLAITFLILVSAASVFAQDTIILQGQYFGKNLYVINPTDSVDNSFCVKKVLINNVDSKDELKSNSFEIDFSLMKITVGTAVKVLIIHNTSCKPKVINAGVLKPPSTFAFLNVKIDKAGKITWTVKGELNTSFIVEQFRWKKWITLGEVDIIDTVKKNVYAFDVTPHFGPNQFRISHTDEKGTVVLSKIIKYRNAALKEINLVSARVGETITFTGETAYEIFDEKGTFIMDGFGKEVDISDLSKGKFWVNYDNKTEMVTKK